VITGLVFRSSLGVTEWEWHRLGVTELRRLRREVNATQRELAALLDVPLNTFRLWDSGLRTAPPHLAPRIREVIAARATDCALLPLAELAKELGVHVRTLQAAARTLCLY
jgi:DNA-binding XRE family transcriptional regulator